MKRIFSVFLSLCLLCSTCSIAVSAAEAPANGNGTQPRASLYLSGYNASASASAKGKMTINYNVSSSVSASSIGVQSIVIRNSGGAVVAAVNGSTGNGLVKSSSSFHAGSYAYYGISGQSYYAEVTVFAKNASGSDSRAITTRTVTLS